MYTGRSCILICENDLPAFADAEAGSRNYIGLHSIVFVNLSNEIPEAVKDVVYISSQKVGPIHFALLETMQMSLMKKSLQQIIRELQ